MYSITKEIKALKYKDLQIARIVATDTLDILCIALEKNALFPEHSSPRDAHLIVLEGAIDFMINGKTFRINHQEHFDFPADTKHEVQALEHSKFLIVR